MGRNKKVSSIVEHLNKKWKAAKGDSFIRLVSPSGDLSWGEEDKGITVSKLYGLLLASGTVLKLHYCFVIPGKTLFLNTLLNDDINFTPSLESAVGNLLDNVENIERNALTESHEYLSFDPISSPVSNVPPNEDEEDGFFFNEGFPNPLVIPSNSTLQEYDSLPATPFKVNGSLEATSRDGFSPMSRTRKYEGKCREYWLQCEESVDYSSFYTGKRKREFSKTSSLEPVNKKRLVNA